MGWYEKKQNDSGVWKACEEKVALLGLDFLSKMGQREETLSKVVDRL